MLLVSKQRRDKEEMKIKLLLAISTALMLTSCSPAIASPDFEALSRAINRVENGPTLSEGELFGIHSVHYKDRLEARVICIRTCRRAWTRYEAAVGARNANVGVYMNYLSRQYCPFNSINWKRMVSQYYKGGV